MKDLILQNTKEKWVLSARITYVREFEPYPYTLSVGKHLSKLGYQESFKTLRAAKTGFTKQFYKGVWKVSDL